MNSHALHELHELHEQSPCCVDTSVLFDRYGVLRLCECEKVVVCNQDDKMTVTLTEPDDGQAIAISLDRKFRESARFATIDGVDASELAMMYDGGPLPIKSECGMCQSVACVSVNVVFYEFDSSGNRSPSYRVTGSCGAARWRTLITAGDMDDARHRFNCDVPLSQAITRSVSEDAAFDCGAAVDDGVGGVFHGCESPPPPSPKSPLAPRKRKRF
jgi:hypothetical protein